MSTLEPPPWLHSVADRAARNEELPVASALGPKAMSIDERDLPAARRSSVLILFGEGPRGPDVLLIRRADGLRKHAGQPAFPGGGVESGDADVVATALREATEETGLDPAGVAILGSLGDLWIPVSKSVVTPVVGWWHTPSKVHAADPAEIAAVVRVPLRDLADAGARGVISLPRGKSPAFEVSGLVIWGFTGVIISALLGWLGMDQPWDAGRELGLPPGDAGPQPVTVDR